MPAQTRSDSFHPTRISRRFSDVHLRRRSIPPPFGAVNTAIPGAKRTHRSPGNLRQSAKSVDPPPQPPAPIEAKRCENCSATGGSVLSHQTPAVRAGSASDRTPSAGRGPSARAKRTQTPPAVRPPTSGGSLRPCVPPSLSTSPPCLVPFQTNPSPKRRPSACGVSRL